MAKYRKQQALAGKKSASLRVQRAFNERSTSVQPKVNSSSSSSSSVQKTVAAVEPAAPVAPPNPDVKRFIDRFYHLYAKYRHGAKYLVHGKKDGALVRHMLAVHDLERLTKLAVILLTTDHEWVTQTDRGIGILSTKLTWLDGLLAEHEAKHGPVPLDAEDAA